MNKKTLNAAMLVALMTAGLPQLAFAQELNYSFIEGGVSWLSGDGIPDTETGFNIRASADLGRGFYLQGAWDSNEFRSFDLYRIGAGYRYAVQQGTDLFFEAAYAALESDSLDDDGFRTDIGVRRAFGPRAEGRIYSGYQGDGSEGDYLLGADLLFKFNDAFGISAGVETFEFDVNIFRTNLRISF